MAKLHVILAK